MMGPLARDFPFIAIVLVLLSRSDAKVFTPCELAQELHRIIDAKYLYREIPLLVCVAGFQNYDTEYHSKQPDGSYYAGIFGIHSSTLKWMVRSKGNLTDEDLVDDLTIFASHVLQLDGVQKDDTVYDFFVDNCLNKGIEIGCSLNPYVTRDYVVYLPKSKVLPGRTKGTRPKTARKER